MRRDPECRPAPGWQSSSHVGRDWSCGNATCPRRPGAPAFQESPQTTGDAPIRRCGRGNVHDSNQHGAISASGAHWVWAYASLGDGSESTRGENDALDGECHRDPGARRSGDDADVVTGRRTHEYDRPCACQRSGWRPGRAVQSFGAGCLGDARQGRRHGLGRSRRRAKPIDGIHRFDRAPTSGSLPRGSAPQRADPGQARVRT